MNKRQRFINQAYASAKYWGKHIIILGNKIYTAKTGVEASKKLEKLIIEFPRFTPLLTYVPKGDALIFTTTFAA